MFTIRHVIGAVLMAVTVVALVCGGILMVAVETGPNAISRAAGVMPDNTKCDDLAISELPERVVDQVYAAQRHAQIPKGMGPTVMTRPVGGGMEDVAFVDFLPKYCGFIGNINGRPVTDDAAHGRTSPDLKEAQKDRVIMLNAYGSVATYREDVCISNTPPTVRKTDGMVMTIRCDRWYPQATWMQAHPVLNAS